MEQEKVVLSIPCAKKLFKNNDNFILMKAPNYDLITGKLINDLLMGKLVDDPFTVDPITTSLCYTVDRLIGYRFMILKNRCQIKVLIHL